MGQLAQVPAKHFLTDADVTARWGPSDNRMKLEQRTSRRPTLNLGSNSPWSKEAGLSRPHDPAARRLARAGVNVNGGLQV